MAKADYRCCDICDEKVFYDSRLNYEDQQSRPHGTPYRIAGNEQYDKPTLLEKHGINLDSLGDWAVICNECSKTFKCVIVSLTPKQEIE
jgi:hypothetical protein